MDKAIAEELKKKRGELERAKAPEVRRKREEERKKE